MKYRKFCSFYSPDRVSRYLRAANNNHKKAIQLYYQNQMLAKSFHPLLGMYEVVLRNRLNHILSVHFNDSDWIINQRTGFMHNYSINHRRHRQDHYALLEQVNAEIAKLQNSGAQVTASKIVSELNFGFWTLLFEPSHSSLLGDIPMTVFSKNTDPSWDVQMYYNMVQAVRLFRNRVSHNESSIFNGNSLDLAGAKQIYKYICDSLNWIDSSIMSDFEKHSLNTVPDVISRIEAKKRPCFLKRILSR